MPEKNSHCSYCGRAFEPGLRWPRRCAGCGRTSFVNPTPVAVVIQPVDGQVVLIRRGIEPGVGLLALPGGYMDLGESWQSAAAREMREETGIVIDPAGLVEFRVRSTPDGLLVVVFAVAPPLPRRSLPRFRPTDETTELVLVGEPCPLAFDLHTEVLADWLAAR